jgi:hypothetical protein
VTNTTNTSGSTEPNEKQKEALSVADLEMRDYFAAKAMQALIPICVKDTREEGVTYEEHTAENAYLFADSMLRARSQS